MKFTQVMIKLNYNLEKRMVSGMSKVHFSDELMKHISSMDRENSIVQFRIPGKGKFTLVLQEEDERSIEADVEANPQLGKMITKSQEQYKNGLGMSTQELLKSMSVKDFK